MTNNNQLCESILGLMRVSLFGEVAGEDIVSELEECRELWTVVVPGTDIGTEHQTQNVVLGRMVFDELRILTVNTGRKIPKSSVENSPVLQAILKMAALSSGVLRP